MTAVNVLRPIEDDDRNRLDPGKLHDDATWLMENNGDMRALLVSLLRTIRQNCDREDAIRQSYEFSYRRQQEDLDRLQAEVNDFREALRTVKRATRNIKVGH